MFRDQTQRAISCELLASIPAWHPQGYFRATGTPGPTTKAFRAIVEANVSAAEYTMLRAALDFWGRYGGGCTIREVLALNSQNREAVASLLLAYAKDDGGKAIDEWLQAHRIKESA